jgi:hypothetical protein
MCPYEVTLPWGTSWTALYTIVYHAAASSERGMASNVVLSMIIEGKPAFSRLALLLSLRRFDGALSWNALSHD